MQPRHPKHIARPPPLDVAADDAWTGELIHDAARRWYTPSLRPEPAFQLAQSASVRLVTGPVPRGTHYMIQRSVRAVAVGAIRLVNAPTC